MCWRCVVCKRWLPDTQEACPGPCGQWKPAEVGVSGYEKKCKSSHFAARRLPPIPDAFNVKSPRFLIYYIDPLTRSSHCTGWLREHASDMVNDPRGKEGP